MRFFVCNNFDTVWNFYLICYNTNMKVIHIIGEKNDLHETGVIQCAKSF